MFKSLTKKFFILGLVFQFYIFIAANNEFFEISLMKAISGITLFLIPIIYATDVLNLIKTRSLDTLFFMNTTLFMACLNSRDDIYNNLIKDSLHQITDKVDGYQK